MDQFARNYCRMVFRERFTDAHGDEFQRFFGQIMSMRYPGDFVQTRPWGPLGDEKCDGYLPSQRTFYQCYAPESAPLATSIAKLREDFDGAKPHAAKFFSTWVWVHNDRDGRIPSLMAFEIEKLRQENPDIQIKTLGYSELLSEAQELSDLKLVDLLGPYPSYQDLRAVQFQDIRPLLAHVAGQGATSDGEVKPVPANKLEYNKLSEEVGFFLRTGSLKSALVKSYLDQVPDRSLGTRVSTSFRSKYEALRQEESDPDEIFRGLRVFAQGEFAQSPRTEGAVLAVLAYLFEECDIFERPPDH
jgi:hypothetical protein